MHRNIDSNANPRHGERGQALFETAWLIPFVLFSLALMCFSAKFGVVMENVESAVHYANTVGSTRGVFLRSSLFSLYDGASEGAHQVSQQICYADGAAEIIQTGRIYFDSDQYTGRHRMWSVPSASVACTSGSVVFPAGTFQRALVLNYELPVITANMTSIFGFKLFPNGILPDVSSHSPARFSTVSNRNLVACYSGLRTILQNSLFHGAAGTGSDDPLASASASDLQEAAPINPQADQVDGTTCGG